MDNVRVIILAKSYKNGARCIAGKRCESVPDNKVRLYEWVRPSIINSTGEAIGPITESEYRYANKTGYTQVLDIMDIPYGGDCDVAGQPDNFVVNKNQNWSKSGRFRADCVFNIVDTPNDIWLDSTTGTHQVTKDYVDKGNVTQSLYLIRPTAFQITLSNEYNPWEERYQRKALASFDYNGTSYSHISVTCPATRKMLKDDYPAEGGNAVNISLPDGDEYAIVLSLSPIWHTTEMHYKFIATIFDKSGKLQQDFKA
ncbi:hypothetical protein AAFM81_003818 [Vibrio fluvialis]|nr:hypothetical protein [Vibrio parahaemolyticus]